MRKVKSFIFTLFILGMVPSFAWAIEGFSGAMWGIGIYDTLEPNTKTLGFIRQGIDWVYVYDTKISTYTQFRYRFEREESTFFDAYGPSLGISGKNGPFRFGLEYLWERFPKRDKNNNEARLFIEYYIGWDLKNLIK